MKLYYSTNEATAHRILNQGFENEPYAGDARGVLLTTHRLDENEGRLGDEQLLIEIANDVIGEYEIVPLELSDAETSALHESGYREWLVPADVLNAHAQVTVDEGADLEPEP
jgi:hypothetical protein